MSIPLFPREGNSGVVQVTHLGHILRKAGRLVSWREKEKSKMTTLTKDFVLEQAKKTVLAHGAHPALVLTEWVDESYFISVLDGFGSPQETHEERLSYLLRCGQQIGSFEPTLGVARVVLLCEMWWVSHTLTHETRNQVLREMAVRPSQHPQRKEGMLLLFQDTIMPFTKDVALLEILRIGDTVDLVDVQEGTGWQMYFSLLDSFVAGITQGQQKSLEEEGPPFSFFLRP